MNLYQALFAESRDVIRSHVEALVAQATRIVEDGVRRGEFEVDDPQAAARALFDATARFHDPAHAAEWKDTAAGDAAFERVWALLIRGMAAPR